MANGHGQSDNLRYNRTTLHCVSHQTSAGIPAWKPAVCDRGPSMFNAKSKPQLLARPA